jgi:hypothetical protein
LIGDEAGVVEVRGDAEGTGDCPPTLTNADEHVPLGIALEHHVPSLPAEPFNVIDDQVLRERCGRDGQYFMQDTSV